MVITRRCMISNPQLQTPPFLNHFPGFSCRPSRPSTWVFPPDFHSLSITERPKCFSLLLSPCDGMCFSGFFTFPPLNLFGSPKINQQNTSEFFPEGRPSPGLGSSGTFLKPVVGGIWCSSRSLFFVCSPHMRLLQTWLGTVWFQDISIPYQNEPYVFCGLSGFWAIPSFFSFLGGFLPNWVAFPIFSF